jgi:transcriptional antiterminator RfaH
MEHWYLVHTKPNRERGVAVQLHQRGLIVYLPLIWNSPVSSRGSREQPYFPGYLFARLNPQAVGLNVVRWSPGVSGLVEADSEPVSISDAFVAELQQRLNHSRADRDMGQKAARTGDFLQVNRGPFEGYEGIFNAQLLGPDRAQILLACVQQEYSRQMIQPRRRATLPDDSAAHSRNS